MPQEALRQFSTVYLATDHAGFSHKEAIRTWLEAENFIVIDAGAYTVDGEDDFPDYVFPAVAAALSDASNESAAVVFGGSGQGEAMAANRLPGARATVYYGGDAAIPALSRQHNHANVLSVGARFVSVEEAKEVIWRWLHTPPLYEEKYDRRNRKLDGVV